MPCHIANNNSKDIFANKLVTWFKKMYVSCRVYLRYYFTTRHPEPTVLVACPVSCLRFFENAWTPSERQIS